MSPGTRYITPKHAAGDLLPLDPFHLSVAHSAGISSIQENMAEGSARLSEDSARLAEGSWHGWLEGNRLHASPGGSTVSKP